MYVSNIVTYHYLYIYIKIPEQPIYTITNELIEKLLIDLNTTFFKILFVTYVLYMY